MKIYLVGGAVRDQLLNRPIKEKDWVVVGSSVHDMLKLGFRQVGKDFPVFLHPENNEEYALARKERKIGLGYTGFEFDTSPEVTLAEDLMRRDLTINAMAQDEKGQLIDPFHGREDLNQGLLRHVSPAFAEDPVRILRVGRFAARFGFKVAAETIHLMHNMVRHGEVDALVPERVWKELERSLIEPSPELFFKVLHDCGALSKIFPEIIYPGPGIAALQHAVGLSPKGTIRFAALLHPLSEIQAQQLCARIRVPTDYKELSLLVIKHLSSCLKPNATPEQVLTLLSALDVFRREARFQDFLTTLKACKPEYSFDWINDCHQVVKAINLKELTQGNGADIARKIREKRLAVLKAYLPKNKWKA